MRPTKPLSPDAVGMLYDSTLCVGCKACVAGCKRANDMPPEIDPGQGEWNQGMWDTPKDTSGQDPEHHQGLPQRRHGARRTGRRTASPSSRSSAYHCADPSCVSCCPVSAMTKDPVSGIVRHDKDRCIGCRYCVFACPFQVPKFEYDEPFGQIQKCQLCKHRLAKGELPGCVDSCPTGATLFGRVADLRAEAHRRIALTPGETYAYPRGDVSRPHRPRHAGERKDRHRPVPAGGLRREDPRRHPGALRLRRPLRQARAAVQEHAGPQLRVADGGRAALSLQGHDRAGRRADRR